MPARIDQTLEAMNRVDQSLEVLAEIGGKVHEAALKLATALRSGGGGENVDSVVSYQELSIGIIAEIASLARRTPSRSARGRYGKKRLASLSNKRAAALPYRLVIDLA